MASPLSLLSLNLQLFIKITFGVGLFFLLLVLLEVVMLGGVLLGICFSPLQKEKERGKISKEWMTVQVFQKNPFLGWNACLEKGKKIFKEE